MLRCCIQLHYRITNSRILAEFREIDSYLTDDDSDEEYDGMPPALAQKELDNSVLRMGQSLIQAAKVNPIEGTSDIPRITLRLTRLDSSSENVDSRITQTVRLLGEMNIDVALGEHSESELAACMSSLLSFPSLPCSPRPTRRVALDLSVLIALVSNLTHFPLPATLEEADQRFIPSLEYRHWKEIHIEHKSSQAKASKVFPERSVEDLPEIYLKQAQALTRQLVQEMAKGMIQEIHDQLLEVTGGDFSKVEFWTTPEARSRCLSIVSKIGSTDEKLRVRALLEHGTDLKGRIQAYWKRSRYPPQFLPILPINIFSASSNHEHVLVRDEDGSDPSAFSRVLKKTCEYILAQGVISDSRATLNGPDSTDNQVINCETGEIQRAAVIKVNPRLTAHTVQSMLWGAQLGWTILTGNKSSVKAIFREIRAAAVSGQLDEADIEYGLGLGCRGFNDAFGDSAVLWVTDPRSLAGGMSSLPIEAGEGIESQAVY